MHILNKKPEWFKYPRTFWITSGHDFLMSDGSFDRIGTHSTLKNFETEKVAREEIAGMEFPYDTLLKIAETRKRFFLGIDLNKEGAALKFRMEFPFKGRKLANVLGWKGEYADRTATAVAGYAILKTRQGLLEVKNTARMGALDKIIKGYAELSERVWEERIKPYVEFD